MTTRAAQGQALDRGPLLTVAQASEYLGTGERFICRLINGPSYRLKDRAALTTGGAPMP